MLCFVLGIFEVIFVSGIVLDMEFILRVDQFSDDLDDYFLIYQFGYYEFINGEEFVFVISLLNC